MSNSSMAKLFAVVFVASLVGAYIGGGPLAGFTAVPSEPTPSDPAAPSNPTPPTTPPPTGGTLTLTDLYDDSDWVKGDPNAPVTIVEFSDFQCPFCSRWYEQTLPSLLENYIDEGKVKLVYRDFPLSFHPEAGPAAEAAECAGEQGKFWAFHDLIFENQGLLSNAQYKTWAADLGLNTGQFDDCLDTGKYSAEVQADFAAGSAAGVSGTPTFFLGASDGTGQKIVGAQPLAAFTGPIDALLAA